MDELISRQAAIDAVLDRMNIEKYGRDAKPEEIRWTLEKLPPVQPKQTDCEYCHTDRDGYVFPLEKNSHAFIDRDKIVLKANGWRGEAKIKYCPICGRRLTDG